MKCDEWRLWKNNSKKERRRTKTTSRRQRESAKVSDSLGHASASTIIALSEVPVQPTSSTSFYGILVPDGPLDISNLLSMIRQLHKTPILGLEIILKKWKSDGSYLDGTLQYLQDNRFFLRINHETMDGQSIFHLMDTKISSPEQLRLAKQTLEIDYERAQADNLTTPNLWRFPEWMRMWRLACGSLRWREMEEYLGKINTGPEGPGPVFLGTARLLLAEKLLFRNMLETNRWHAVNSQEACTDTDNIYWRETLDILNSFAHAMINVDVSWYQWFIQCTERFHKQQQKELEKYRRILVSLKARFDSADGENDLSQGLLNTVKCKQHHVSQDIF